MRRFTPCRLLSGGFTFDSVQGVSATRVFWVEGGGGNSETFASLYASATPDVVTKIQSFDLFCVPGNANCGCGTQGDLAGSAAAGDGTLIYADKLLAGDPATCASFGGEPVIVGGSVERALGAGRARIAGAPVASLVAAPAVSGRFAELLAVINGQPPQSQVQVRNVVGGALVRTITPGGQVLALGYSSAGVGMQVDVAGVNTLRLYSPTTGAQVRSVWVRPARS